MPISRLLWRMTRDMNKKPTIRTITKKIVGEISGTVICMSLLKPFAPHLASEMLEKLKTDDEWPKWDEKYLINDTVEIVVQVNGKLRATIKIALDSEENIVKEIVHKQEAIIRATEGKTIVKEIYIKNKIYNIVVK